MFSVTLLFCFYFVQFSVSAAFDGTGGGLFGFVFGYQKLCICRCGIAQRQFTGNVRSARLLGGAGDSTTPHQFPWLATVNIGSQLIVGSVISDRHVVTTAAPLYGIPAGRIKVTLGVHDRCNHDDPALNSSVAEVMLHPAFSPTNKNNDIALLKLRHVVAFSQFVAPICLPFYDFEDSGHVAWTASWAENGNFSCTPRVATMPMLSPRVCLKGAEARLVTPDKGCLGPLGARSIICDSDIGAPVMTRWTSRSSFRLVGLMSTSSCDSTSTALYTRTMDHIAWIHEHIRGDCQCF